MILLAPWKRIRLDREKIGYFEMHEKNRKQQELHVLYKKYKKFVEKAVNVFRVNSEIVSEKRVQRHSDNSGLFSM
jgi:hypothetical protein